MKWDFCESMPISESTRNGSKAMQALTEQSLCIRYRFSGELRFKYNNPTPPTIRLPDETASVWFTDPPYYDAVPYADLSDFFLVWLKRALPDHSVAARSVQSG